MNKPKILAFAGSTRTDSLNKKLARAAAAIAGEAGAEVTFVDLRDLALPLYDGDLEEASGLPEGARKLKALLRASDGFLIASPEYNSSVTAVLKNALDWASRAETDDEPPLAAFRGKAAALLSASPGALGGLRGLVHLRAILGNMTRLCPSRVWLVWTSFLWLLAMAPQARAQQPHGKPALAPPASAICDSANPGASGSPS